MLAFTVKNSMLDTSGMTVLNASAKEPPINVLEFKTISQMMNKMTNPVILIIVVEAKAEGVTEVGAKTVVAAEERMIEVRALKTRRARDLSVKLRLLTVTQQMLRLLFWAFLCPPSRRVVLQLRDLYVSSSVFVWPTTMMINTSTTMMMKTLMPYPPPYG
jgi:hypothetical protein